MILHTDQVLNNSILNDTRISVLIESIAYSFVIKFNSFFKISKIQLLIPVKSLNIELNRHRV